MLGAVANLTVPVRIVMTQMIALAVLLLTFGTAQAQSSDRVPYSQPQVYSAAVRYLRIDLRYEITERDPEVAYLLFEYQPLGQNSRRFGAVEIVKLQQGVRLVVRLPDQPSYQETMLRDGLLKKLRTDYGDSPRPKDPDPAPPKGQDQDKAPPSANTPSNDSRPNVRSSMDS